MTREEALSFFDRIRGEKIRYSAWPKGSYFIPYELGSSIDQFIGDKYYESGHINMEMVYSIERGFHTDSYGYRWEYFIDMDKELDNV